MARKKATNDLYAIKALNRKEMVRRNEMQSIFAERNIMANISSEHVVKMFFAMASKKYLFFVMEFMAGGDLFSLLRKFGRLEEVTAKFYVAEIVLALEDLHKQGIVHRDLVSPLCCVVLCCVVVFVFVFCFCIGLVWFVFCCCVDSFFFFD